MVGVDAGRLARKADDAREALLARWVAYRCREDLVRAIRNVEREAPAASARRFLGVSLVLP
jgi:hypothetical protein